jgi:hypothetical protein
MTDIPRAKPRAAPREEPEMRDVPREPAADWREQAIRMSEGAAKQIAVREHSRNPAFPNNFLDMSDAGFPADIIVKGFQIPRAGLPQEMAQYRTVIDYQWLHVPWEWISVNDGMDGKARIPNARKVPLGDGQFVAALGNDYLMFANRWQYENRRKENRETRNRVAEIKIEDRVEEVESGHRRAVSMEKHSSVSLEEMLEMEKRAGDEPSIVGRIDT